MQASLLDRLIDLEPDASREPVQFRHISYGQAKGAVARDLENLLNTKCFTSDIPESYRELGRSVYRYGLTDFTSRNPGSPEVRADLRQEIEKTVRLFEPRLKDVTVKVEDAERKEHRLRIIISALLVMDNEHEPVSFDTFFDISRDEYSIPRQTG